MAIKKRSTKKPVRKGRRKSEMFLLHELFMVQIEDLRRQLEELRASVRTLEMEKRTHKITIPVHPSEPRKRIIPLTPGDERPTKPWRPWQEDDQFNFPRRDPRRSVPDVICGTSPLA